MFVKNFTLFIIQNGKLADLVLWKPAFFGVKPETIVKGGHIAWAQMGKTLYKFIFNSKAKT